MTGARFSVIPLVRQDRSSFASGSAALDSYLRLQAGQDMKRRVAACFLAMDATTGAVAGYYTLSACHVRLEDVATDWQKRLPRYPEVPAVRLGRLAVDRSYQGQKIGAALLADAGARALRSDVAAHMMIVDAKDGSAAAFYAHHGFRADPRDPLRLYIPLAALGRGPTIPPTPG
jgi:GNAT superfamily N-acetyltransferase